jgi:multicomponent Na+:H+ antiporter subunit D
LGLYGLLRLHWTVFSDVLALDSAGLQSILLAAGSLTAVLGAVMCYLQRHIKRMLAYSTVSHAGAFVIGAACLTPEGVAGSGLYVLGHGLVKGALFMVAGILLHRYSTVDEIELTGRGRDAWPAGLLFGLGGLALAGAPIFLTGLGKSVLEEALPERVSVLLVGVLLVSSVLTGGAVLRTTGRVFLGLGRDVHDAASRAPTHGEEMQETDEPASGIPWTMLLPAAVLILLALWFGVIPGPLEQAGTAAERFVDAHAYAAAVLDGTSVDLHAGAPRVHLSTSGNLLGIVGAVAAVVVAVLALGLAPLSAGMRRRVGALVEAVARPLRSIHSGHVGDYATWLMLGAAAFGAECTFVLR